MTSSDLKESRKRIFLVDDHPLVREWLGHLINRQTDLTLEEFHPGLDGGEFRAEFKISPKSPLFGVIAMMRLEKGQRTFINAAAKVLSLVSDARFVIVGGGGGSYVDRLYAKIRRTFPRSPAPVIITGYREDLSQVIAALDFVVVPSLREAQTIVIPQAFAAGKPVIASLVGGIPKLVRHEQNGQVKRVFW
jgi:glycosyltransferase involved in cell wall biosynthesis